MSDLKGIDIHDVFGVEEPLTKLIECVSKGIGKVYEPTHIKRLAKAKAEEINIISNSIKDNLDLPISYDESKISIDSKNLNELLNRTRSRVLYHELLKQHNIDDIIYDTYNDLKRDVSITSEPVDTDWLFKYFEFCGDVSNEQMKKLWSRILSSEIKKPHSFSLRTIETMSKLSSYEANLFKSIAPFFISYSAKDSILYANTELFAKYGLSFNSLLVLEDSGLINLNPSIVMVAKKELYTSNLILLLEEPINFSVYTLTESGKQLYSLFKFEQPSNFDYFLDVCRNIRDNNIDIKSACYKIINMENDPATDEVKIEFENSNNLLN